MRRPPPPRRYPGRPAAVPAAARRARRGHRHPPRPGCAGASRGSSHALAPLRSLVDRLQRRALGHPVVPGGPAGQPPLEPRGEVLADPARVVDAVRRPGPHRAGCRRLPPGRVGLDAERGEHVRRDPPVPVPVQVQPVHAPEVRRGERVVGPQVDQARAVPPRHLGDHRVEQPGPGVEDVAPGQPQVGRGEGEEQQVGAVRAQFAGHPVQAVGQPGRIEAAAQRVVPAGGEAHQRRPQLVRHRYLLGHDRGEEPAADRQVGVGEVGYPLGQPRGDQVRPAAVVPRRRIEVVQALGEAVPHRHVTTPHVLLRHKSRALAGPATLRSGHATHVPTARPHATRRPRGRRSTQPPIVDQGRLHPVGGPGWVPVAAAGQARPRPGGPGDPRGAGRPRRSGGLVPGPAAARAVRAQRPVGRVRRRHLPAHRPARRREFLMKDSYSFDLTDAGLAAAYAAHREAYQRIFDRLGLRCTPVAAMSGPMGGSVSEEFLAETPVGEDTFVGCAACGYAANVEAVTTPAPPVADLEHPPLQVLDTPDTPTIDSLVALLNTMGAGGRTGWRAGEMLKNVVLTVDGELLVIGVPGDRDVDLKRVEAALFPARVAMFEDFPSRPDLVRGYLGPQGTWKARYLVDPRIVEGTAWVTGANEPGRHAITVVCGRDFVPDGTIEAATVRAGDACPRCGTGLELRRGVEVGHISQLGRKYADVFGLDALGPDGKPLRVTMGSYGIGLTRAVAVVVEQRHDERGLVWPAEIAPAHVHLVPLRDPEPALALAAELEAAGLRVLVDDRPGLSAGVRFTDAELLGMPHTVVLGRRLAEGYVELRDRATGERRDLPVGQLTALLV